MAGNLSLAHGDSGQVQVVDEHGQLVEATIPNLAARVQVLQDEVRGLERNLKAEIRRHEELKRDREAEAKDDPLWPLAARLFLYHQRMTGHPKTEWSWERFEMCRPYLKRKKYGLEGCLRAIAGARFDSWKKMRRNGTVYVHDGWDVIFSKPGVFEDFMAKAPADWSPPAGALGA